MDERRSGGVSEDENVAAVWEMTIGGGENDIKGRRRLRGGGKNREEVEENI